MNLVLLPTLLEVRTDEQINPLTLLHTIIHLQDKIFIHTVMLGMIVKCMVKIGHTNLHKQDRETYNS